MHLWLYRILYRGFIPFIFARLLIKSRRDKGYSAHWAERVGFYKHTSPCFFWVHAASVGEVNAAANIISSCLQAYPERSIVVTVMTPTGRNQVEKSFAQEPRIQCVYVPYDCVGFVRRFLRCFQPKQCLILETEIWPVLIQTAQQHGVAIMLANGRLSSRSCRRYAYVRPLMIDILACFSAIAVQTPQDAKRFIWLGALADKVTVVGSIKFDSIGLDKPLVWHPRFMVAKQTTLIGLSTHAGEEATLIEAFHILKQHMPEVRLIVVPRHVHRLEAIIASNKRLNSYDVVLSSALDPEVYQTFDILMVDQMGVVKPLLAIAGLAFVGGSLIAHGGQNPIEAAYAKLPMMMGESRYNFHAICRALSGVGAMKLVTGKDDIVKCAMHWFQNPMLQIDSGACAHAHVSAQIGATQRHMAIIRRL